MGAIAGLQEHLKLARDYALEGMYESSIIFFDGAIAQINKYVNIFFFTFCRSLVGAISYHLALYCM